MEIEIIKLLDKNGVIFDKVCEWHYNWWGKRDGYDIKEVTSYVEHSIFENRIPQTFVAFLDDQPVGMYQFFMSDDLDHRHDIYPWLVNVYVDERYRGNGICKALMNTVSDNAKKVGIQELFLYTKHNGLYEKYGWEFIEMIETFKDFSPIERLYKLNIQ